MHGALNDDWSRYFERLSELKAEHMKSILSGTLSPEKYAAHCEAVRVLDEVRAEAERIRRHEDINPPQVESVAEAYDA